VCAPIPVAALAAAGEVRLADARCARIRPIECADGTRVQAFVAGLSPRTSRRRFLRPVKGLTPRMLAQVVEVDYARSLSLVAEAGGEIIGLAQYAASPGERAADIALVVADAWQGIGLGRHLLGALVVLAANQGFERLDGDAFDDNDPILALMQGFGFHARPHPEEPDLVRLERELGGPWPVDGERLAAALWDLPTVG
jgi:acetyltransferase